MSRPSSSRSHRYPHSRPGGNHHSPRDLEDRCESFPFDECSGSADVSREDDSSFVLQQSRCHPSSSSSDRRGGGKAILDAFACLCIGSGEANDYIDESEHYYTSGRSRKSKASSGSPRDERKLVKPIAYVADHETGTFLERPHRTKKTASFPASRFVFRPVSDEDTTITGFESTYSRGWEI